MGLGKLTENNWPKDKLIESQIDRKQLIERAIVRKKVYINWSILYKIVMFLKYI